MTEEVDMATRGDESARRAGEDASASDRPAESVVPARERSRHGMGRFLRRYGWLVALTLILSVGVTFFRTRGTEPVYRGTATLEVSPPRTGLSIDDLLGVADSGAEYIETMARRITMRRVLEPVYEEFRFPEQTFESFRAEITAEPEAGTNLVLITFEGTSRERIVEVLSLTIERFLAWVASDRSELSLSSREVLDSETEELRKQIDSARARLDAFMEEHGLRSSIEAEWDLLHVQLLEKGRTCEATRGELAPVEAVYAEIQRMRARGEDLSTLPLVVSNGAYAELEERLREIDRDLVAAAVEVNANTLAYRALQEKQKATRNQIERLLRRLVEQAERDYTIRKSSFDLLTQEREQLEVRIRLMDRKKFEYDRIQRDVDRYQTYYEKYLQAIGDIEPVHDISKAHVRVREEPAAPSRPVKPNWKVNLGLAVLAGLLGGILLGLLLESLRG